MIKLLLFMAISYLNMQSQVTIGDVVFNNIHSFNVDQSVKELSDKAVIVLPRNYLKLKGNPVLNYISAGLPVTIACGYNGDMATEFTGFVKPGIDADFPLRIECDQLYPLRQTNHLVSYQDVSLKQLLKDVVSGYTIQCPDVDLGKIRIHNGTSTIEVLKYLRETYGIFAKVYGSTLRMWWPFDYSTNAAGFTSQYTFTYGVNIKSVKGLKFLLNNDFNTQVNVNILQTNGRKRKVVYGTPGDGKVQEVNRYNISDAQAQQIAQAIQAQTTYNGYFGNFVSFGTPRTNAGDTITIVDTVNPERQGDYVLERVGVDYLPNHISRTNYISFKASA